MTQSSQLDLSAPRILLWADLHLRQDSPQELSSFLKSLRQHAQPGDAVVILGDLFDAYWGPKQWRQPAWSGLADTFEQLASQSVAIYLVRGNRDVLAQTADFPFWQVCDFMLFDSSEGRILMSHGDAYCTADLPYQRLRRALRNPLMAGVLRRLPVFLQKSMAGRLRKVSKDAVPKKAMDARALQPEAVEANLAVKGAQKAIVGHLHAAEIRTLSGGRFLQVLPAWQPGDAPVILLQR